MSPFFSLSFAGVPPTFSFSLSFFVGRTTFCSGGNKRRLLVSLLPPVSFNRVNTVTVWIIVELSRARAEHHEWVNLPIPENLVTTWPYTERPFVRTTVYRKITQSTSMANPNANSRLFWREIAQPPVSCKVETTKESIKTKTKKTKKSGNCFCIRVVYSIKLWWIVMTTNLEYRARERQRKRESRRQASEAQREKGTDI